MIALAGMVPLSLVDMPGQLATTVFTRGCNLQCPYCQNAELVQGAAATLPLDFEELKAFLMKRRPVLEYVVVTGGEPTLHPDLPAFLDWVKNLGYRVKLDTNGSRPDMVQRLLEDGLCDYVAMDVKTSWNHYARVGASGASPFRESSAVIRDLAPDYEFRTTMAPGIVGYEDLLMIARDLMGSRRHVLQQFVPKGPLLDPRWRSVKPFSDASLIQWQQELAPLFGEVLVRNLGATMSR